MMLRIRLFFVHQRALWKIAQFKWHKRFLRLWWNHFILPQFMKHQATILDWSVTGRVHLSEFEDATTRRRRLAGEFEEVDQFRHLL